MLRMKISLKKHIKQQTYHCPLKKVCRVLHLELACLPKTASHRECLRQKNFNVYTSVILFFIFKRMKIRN